MFAFVSEKLVINSPHSSRLRYRLLRNHLNTGCFYQTFHCTSRCFLANEEVNSPRHETLACPCFSGGNQSVSERLVNPSLMLVLDDSRKPTWLGHSTLKMACL